ncbi:MAG: ABC transporter ATP-binding protein [Myxococcales bacterium]|jgi:ABC-type multidrug transport system ATPase subunit
MVIVEALGIHKSLGRRAVLRGFDLRLERGERVVILGENGSGKSTFLYIVASVLEPDAGTVHVSVALGFAPEKPDIPEHLSVGEWLDIVASLKGERTVGALPFGVDQLTEKRVSALSLGQRQRVSLASAWLGDPELLVLDEPTNGLDAATQAELTRRLSDTSALVATHDPHFAAAIATRVIGLS